MNCDWVQQNITLHLYNELADDARHELEQHVARCTDCAAELSAQQQFQSAMSVLPVEEVSPSFLTAARMKLQESLEQVQPNRAWYHRFSFDPSAWMRQVRFSPALASVARTMIRIQSITPGTGRLVQTFITIFPGSSMSPLYSARHPEPMANSRGHSPVPAPMARS